MRYRIAPTTSERATHLFEGGVEMKLAVIENPSLN